MAIIKFTKLLAAFLLVTVVAARPPSPSPAGNGMQAVCMPVCLARFNECVKKGNPAETESVCLDTMCFKDGENASPSRLG